MINNNKLVLTRTIPAKPNEVFTAFTDKEKVEKWFSPEKMTTKAHAFDPKEGGAFTIGMTDETGKEFVTEGTFKEIAAPEKIVMTWKWTSPGPSEETTITVLFKNVEEGTEITFTHEGFESQEMTQRHEEGWTSSLNKLEKLFTSSSPQ